ncbi:MAG: MBL fold metallo-hydrolase, partial [Chloroflexota bacterium]|nr:MBL fold metallo-hydrolase [Chloroflexota bacterium]
MTGPDWFEVVRFPAGVTMIAEPGHQEDVKSYLVEGERDVAVLDTGMGVGNFAGLVASLSDRNPIVLHSHAHFDHIGASAAFDRVHVHASEVDGLREGYPNQQFRRWFAKEYLVGDRLPEGFDASTAAIAGCDPTGTIEHGAQFDLGGRVLEAFHTPGHSPGGITLLDRANRILFPGDAVYAGPMFAWRPY